MKKIALFSVLFTFLAAFFFTACEKDKVVAPLQQTGYANTNNPFDYIGVKHNECLDILAQHEASVNNKIEKAIQVLADNGQGTVDFAAIKSDMALVLSSKDPIGDWITKAQQEGRMSATMFEVMTQLNEIVKKYAFSSQLTQEVIALENTFSGLSLSAQELQTLYGAASVARFSNAYWTANQHQGLESRIQKHHAVIGADIAGATVGGLGTGGIMVVASAALFSWGASELWDAFNTVYTGGGGRFGWRWGGGIYGPPCDPTYACPCTIEPGGGSGELFYMSGTGFAMDASTILMAMDGSELDPGFAEIFNTGIYPQEYDFTVSQEVVDQLYHASGLEAPTGPTVFRAGQKEVIVLESCYVIDFPVVYDDGSEASWIVTITR